MKAAAESVAVSGWRARGAGLLRVLGSERFIFWALFVAVPAFTTAQRFLLGPRSYNNWLVFRTSFLHLWRGQDMYVLHPETYFDLYKYSPTFALAMAPFAVLPDWLGMLLWNVLNAVALFYAIRMATPAGRKRTFVWWFVFLEVVTAAHNQQVNSLLAAMLVFTFLSLERGVAFRAEPSRRGAFSPDWLAPLLVASAGFIKIYGIAAAALFLLYPRRWRLLGALAVWALILFVAPLLVTSPELLRLQYESWARMLANDHAASLGISVLGMLHSWFGLDASKVLVAGIGCALYLLPFPRLLAGVDATRRLWALCSTVIFIIIFNHKAESCTFVIATTGAALWFVTQPTTVLDRALMVLTFVLAVVSPTELFPRSLRTAYVVPYALKALPLVLVWARIQGQLLFGQAARPEAAIQGAPGPVQLEPVDE